MNLYPHDVKNLIYNMHTANGYIFFSFILRREYLFWWGVFQFDLYLKGSLNLFNEIFTGFNQSFV